MACVCRSAVSGGVYRSEAGKHLPLPYEVAMDWAYMLLERLVTQGIRASRDRSYPEPERLEVLRAALKSSSDV